MKCRKREGSKKVGQVKPLRLHDLPAVSCHGCKTILHHSSSKLDPYLLVQQPSHHKAPSVCQLSQNAKRATERAWLQFLLPRWRGKQPLTVTGSIDSDDALAGCGSSLFCVWRPASSASGQINTEIMTFDNCDTQVGSALSTDEVAAMMVTRKSSEMDWGTFTLPLSINYFDKLIAEPNMSHQLLWGRSGLEACE